VENMMYHMANARQKRTVQYPQGPAPARSPPRRKEMTILAQHARQHPSGRPLGARAGREALAQGQRARQHVRRRRRLLDAAWGRCGAVGDGRAGDIQGAPDLPAMEEVKSR
jgi:hypothetical protein